MVKSILKWLLIAVVVILVVFWFLGGGVGKIIGNAGPFPFSLRSLLSSTSSIASFHLPYAPQITEVPQNYYQTDYGQSGSGPSYAPSSPPVNGARSPYAGMVVMVEGAARAQSAGAQYLEISAAPGAPILDIAGWTLQSPLSGALAALPQAASPFIGGRVNAVGSALLSPGGVAIVATGASPVGVSFSENECTGYLGTLQPFTPALPQQCPGPLSEIQDTAQNEARLGASCFSYLSSLPPCTFPAHPPPTLSGACVSEMQTKLSYNGCVEKHQNDPAFPRGSSRLYLAQGRPLWRADHDVIRLLDGEGRVVDVLNY